MTLVTLPTESRTPTAETLDLISWYEGKVRPFLLSTGQQTKVESLDRAAARLRNAAKSSDTELSVCVLGNSGVGKSTLINAVIGGDQAVVPSGGVGPLTAQAVVVRFSETPRLVVEYHSAKQLLQTIFGLEQMFKGELGSTAMGGPEDLEDAEEVTEGDLLEVESSGESPDESEDLVGRERRERRESWRRRAQLLVTGRQDEEREIKYLLDSLREAAGGQRKWGTAPEEADRPRIRAIREALSYARKKERRIVLGTGNADFTKILHDHASGFLAPLIKSLELGWNTPVLRNGITIVDLPGVGVMGDVHREVTRHWIREKANALVIIVDHRGMTESVADALRQTEFLNSLIYSADEPEDDPVVVVAVTRIDDVANSRYTQDLQRQKRKFEHFLDIAHEVREKQRAETERSLEAIWLSGGDVPTARRQVVRNLLSRLEIHPVSAPEYVRLRADDEDDRPFLRTEEQSGIPGLTTSLVRLAEERREKARLRLTTESAVFREQVTAHLRTIQAQWETDNRTAEEINALKTDLEVFLVPLRKELQVRQGGYRTFLKKHIPQRIDDLVAVGSLEARDQINEFLRRLGSAHWATLKASVRRGGRYSGASDIDLPAEFALRFEEPIAEVWSRKILADIRRETRDYAQDNVRLVEAVAQWALEQGARVQPKIVEAQRDAVKADAKKLETVGREMVKEKRDEAKALLITEIENPIRARCENFVLSNRHVGPGVKQRILDLYRELAEEVTEAARKPSVRILQRLFREVDKEIVETLEGHDDPLDAVAQAIVRSQESHLKRTDARQRTKILEDVSQILAAEPKPAAAGGA